MSGHVQTLNTTAEQDQPGFCLCGDEIEAEVRKGEEQALAEIRLHVSTSVSSSEGTEYTRQQFLGFFFFFACFVFGVCVCTDLSVYGKGLGPLENVFKLERHLR